MDRRAFLGLGLAGLPALLAGSRVAALARPPEDGPPPAGRGALALVTADVEAHVVAISLADGRVVARLRTPPGPRSIESGPGGHGVVAHTTEGLLSLLDTSGRRPRLRRVLGGVAVPRYTATSPDGRTAYVTDSERGEIVVLDLERGRVAGRAEVGAHARHVTLDPIGRTLWVALGSKAPAIAVVDVRDPRGPRRRRGLRCSRPWPRRRCPSRTASAPRRPPTCRSCCGASGWWRASDCSASGCSARQRWTTSTRCAATSTSRR